jgi:hypothetical protein
MPLDGIVRRRPFLCLEHKLTEVRHDRRSSHNECAVRGVQQQEWCRHQGFVGKEINKPAIDLLDSGVRLYGLGGFQVLGFGCGLIFGDAGCELALFLFRSLRRYP